MVGIDPAKYRLTSQVGSHDLPRERMYPAGSYFALIQGDALATMTLRSYAGNCFAVVEWGRDPATGEELTDQQREHLVQLGQDALDLADRWAEDKAHLPD